MADALDSKSGIREGVWVRVPPSALSSQREGVKFKASTQRKNLKKRPQTERCKVGRSAGGLQVVCNRADARRALLSRTAPVQ